MLFQHFNTFTSESLIYVPNAYLSKFRTLVMTKSPPFLEQNML
ncbi:hypothetical protein EMIT0180MI3_180004 [Priestia megaterium]